MILNHRTELAFPSYENERENNFQGFCGHNKSYFFIILKFRNSFFFHGKPDNSIKKEKMMYYLQKQLFRKQQKEIVF